MESLVRWTYHDRFRGRGHVEFPLGGPWDRAVLRDSVTRWATTTDVEAVVFVDVPPGGPDYVSQWQYDVYREIAPLIDDADRFVRSHRIELPGQAVVIMWTRK